MENVQNDQKPLSKTAVLNPRQWAPSLRSTKENNLIGLNSAFSRHLSKALVIDELRIFPFSAVGFTIYYHYYKLRVPHFLVYFRGANLMFTDLISMFDYMKEYFAPSISYYYFLKSSSKFKWYASDNIWLGRNPYIS